MAVVTLIGPLKQMASAVAPFETKAATIRHLLDELAIRFPGLEEALAQGVAVAIDGEIYQDQLFQSIGPDAEVQVLPPLAGG